MLFAASNANPLLNNPFNSKKQHQQQTASMFQSHSVGVFGQLSGGGGTYNPVAPSRLNTPSNLITSNANTNTNTTNTTTTTTTTTNNNNTTNTTTAAASIISGDTSSDLATFREALIMHSKNTVFHSHFFADFQFWGI